MHASVSKPCTLLSWPLDVWLCTALGCEQLADRYHRLCAAPSSPEGLSNTLFQSFQSPGMVLGEFMVGSFYWRYLISGEETIPIDGRQPTPEGLVDGVDYAAWAKSSKNQSIHGFAMLCGFKYVIFSKFFEIFCLFPLFWVF